MKADYVPHQIHLSLSQIKKLGSGLSTNLKHSQMGADKGEVVVMLKPQNARKMLTSYRKGKGMRLCMSPDEVEKTLTVGRGFADIGKKIAHYGATAIGTAVGTYFGNPMAGAMVGEVLGQTAENAIDYGLKKGAKKTKKQLEKKAMDAIEDKIEELPKEVKVIAKKAIEEIPEKKFLGVGLYAGGLYGGKLKKGSPEMKERMAKLRAMKKGGSVLDEKFSINDIKNTGRDLFGKGVLDEKFSINDIKNTGRDLFGKGVLDDKFSMRDINKKLKDYIKDGSGMRRKKGRGAFDFLDPNKNGLTDSVNKTFTPDLGRDIGSNLIHKGIPSAVGGLTGMAVGGITGNPLAGLAVGSTVGNYAGTKLADEVGRKTGLGMAKITKLSKPYKTAMMYGKRMKVPNAPLSKFNDINPRVRPSSDEMTLSPYQQLTSPAMNPFVPKYAFQQGGQEGKVMR